MSIVAVGTVFPLVFAIQAAYASRNQALKCLGQMKGRLIFLHFQMRAYDIKYGTVLADRICELSSDFGVAVIKSLHRNETAHECYDLIAVMIADVTAGGIDKIPVSLFSGITTVLQSIILDLEGVREVRDNETPKGLRKFAIFLICVTPVFLAPFWANFCGGASGGQVQTLYVVGNDGTLTPMTQDQSEEAPSPFPFGCVAGYFIGLLYVVITFSLLRVQEALEDPFDGMGEDDIQWQNFSRHLEDVDMYGADGEERRKKANSSDSTTENYQGSGVIGKVD
mmetsp:Transcript_18236/g.26716  ORF Transcript_18236/g.26716 Transcript_18236/m.26716 type:complete len:281 (+) Transcript_18236:215-1057(+)